MKEKEKNRKLSSKFQNFSLILFILSCVVIPSLLVFFQFGDSVVEHANPKAQDQLVANFTINIDNPTTGDIIIFDTSTSTGGSQQYSSIAKTNTYKEYKWTFNDPKVSDSITILPQIDHHYQISGIYNVILEIIDYDGNSATCSKTIDVVQGVFDYEDDYEPNDSLDDAVELSFGDHKGLRINDNDDYFYIADAQAHTTYNIDITYNRDNHLNGQYMRVSSTQQFYFKSWGGIMSITIEEDMEKLIFLVGGDPRLNYSLYIYTGEMTQDSEDTQETNDDASNDDTSQENTDTESDDPFSSIMESIPGFPLEWFYLSLTLVIFGLTLQKTQKYKQ